MIFKMEENPHMSSLDADRQFTYKLHMLTIEKVCDLILNIRSNYESFLKTTLKPLEFYTNLCHHLLFRDFDFHEGLVNKIGDIFKCFVLFHSSLEPQSNCWKIIRTTGTPRTFDWQMLEILISGHLIVNRDDKRR